MTNSHRFPDGTPTCLALASYLMLNSGYEGLASLSLIFKARLEYMAGPKSLNRPSYDRLLPWNIMLRITAALSLVGRTEM